MGALLIYLIFVFGLAALAGVGALYRRREDTARVVVANAAAILDHNLPLGTGLAVAAESERAPVRRALRGMAHWITRGSSFAQAAEKGYPSCPGYVLSVIQAGEQMGQLPAVLRELHAHLAMQGLRRHRIGRASWAYALTLLCILGLVASAAMIFVAPRYREICKDYGIELPAHTARMISVTQSVVGLWAVLLVLVFVAVPVGLYVAFRPRRPQQRLCWSWLGDHLKWSLPGFRRREFYAGLAAMLRIIHLALRSGMPLESAARLASQVDSNHCLRLRMGRFAQMLEVGSPPVQAARQAGLGDVFLRTITAMQRGEQLDPAMRYARDYCDAVSYRWWSAISGICWPIVTVLVGTLIGAFVVSLFLPLVALINATMAY